MWLLLVIKIVSCTIVSLWKLQVIQKSIERTANNFEISTP